MRCYAGAGIRCASPHAQRLSSLLLPALQVRNLWTAPSCCSSKWPAFCCFCCWYKLIVPPSRLQGTWRPPQAPPRASAGPSGQRAGAAGAAAAERQRGRGQGRRGQPAAAVLAGAGGAGGQRMDHVHHEGGRTPRAPSPLPLGVRRSSCWGPWL